MNALIIKKHWLEKIFKKEKTLEIRGLNCNIRGRIYLIESGSGSIVGECEIVNSKQICLKEYKDLQKFHCVSDVTTLPYKKTFAWQIANAKRYDSPIKYTHPKGAIIWVKID